MQVSLHAPVLVHSRTRNRSRKTPRCLDPNIGISFQDILLGPGHETPNLGKITKQFLSHDIEIDSKQSFQISDVRAIAEFSF